MTTSQRGAACRVKAEEAASDNERAAWEAAGKAWDSLKIPKPPLSERGRYLASLGALKRMLAAVPTTEEAASPPSYTPEPPAPEPVKPRPTGAKAPLEFASIEF